MRRSKGKSRAELEKEVRYLKLKVHLYRAQGFLFSGSKVLAEALRAIRVLGPWACAVLIAQALAGKTTVTSLSGRVESESLKDAIAALAKKGGGLTSLFAFLVVMVVCGLLYGKRARFRSDVVQRLGELKRLYERWWDPNQSSSEISKRAETRPEDN